MAKDQVTAAPADETVKGAEDVPAKHPGHAKLDELLEAANTLGSYALSVLQPKIDAVRETL